MDGRLPRRARRRRPRAAGAETGGKAAKASRRDVAALLASGELAGTTVATTMQIAALAGIQVFATGGIGGVHRGAEETFDISADLEELGRTPVAVVCAGAKSILDIAKTLEVLETNGVPVLGYGTDDFPAFWARAQRPQGRPPARHADGGRRGARGCSSTLGIGGVLIANPIPEADALDAAEIEAQIAEALARGRARRASRARTLTPFLLKRIFELTGGKSLVANIALVEEQRRGRGADRGGAGARSRRAAMSGRILVVGDVMTDVIVMPEGPLVRGSDRRAKIRSRPGGSGANQAVWLGTFGRRRALRRRASGPPTRPTLEAYFRAPRRRADPHRRPGAALGRAGHHRRSRRRAELPHRPRRQPQSRRRRPAADPCSRIPTWLVLSGYSFFTEGPRLAATGLMAEARAAGRPRRYRPGIGGFPPRGGGGPLHGMDGWRRPARHQRTTRPPS